MKGTINICLMNVLCIECKPLDKKYALPLAFKLICCSSGDTHLRRFTESNVFTWHKEAVSDIIHKSSVFTRVFLMAKYINSPYKELLTAYPVPGKVLRSPRHTNEYDIPGKFVPIITRLNRKHLSLRADPPSTFLRDTRY